MQVYAGGRGRVIFNRKVNGRATPCLAMMSVILRFVFVVFRAPFDFAAGHEEK
jgi:hypothetical protein